MAEFLNWKFAQKLPGLTRTNFAFSVHEIVCWRARRIPIKARRDRNFDGFLILFKVSANLAQFTAKCRCFVCYISSLSVFKVSRNNKTKKWNKMSMRSQFIVTKCRREQKKLLSALPSFVSMDFFSFAGSKSIIFYTINDRNLRILIARIRFHFHD